MQKVTNTNPSGKRILPQNLEAERSVLGAMIYDPECCATGVDILKPGHFYKPGHDLVFNTIVEMFKEKVRLDLITVTDRLRDRGDLELLGGPAYIAGLVNCVPSVENLEHHANIVIHKALLRATILQTQKLQDAAYGALNEDDILDLIATLPLIPNEIEAFLGNGVATGSAAQSLYERHKNIQERGYAGIRTGWKEIDELLFEGLPLGYPAIISGEPGVGKTAFVIQLLDQIAAKNRVLLFSLEMPRARIWSRRCASKIYRLGLCDDGFNETFIANTASQIEGNPRWKTIVEDETNWHIDDRTRLTFQQIIRAIRSFKRKHPDLRIVAIDHLGRVRLKESMRRQTEREDAILAMTDLAKDMDIIIIWVIQPDTKYLRDQGGKPPSVANIDYYTKAAQEAGVKLDITRVRGSDEITLYITKGRHGGTGGKVKMRFITRVQTFNELST